MLKTILISLVISYFLPTEAHSNTIGRVVKVRGDATILSPHSTQAIQIKKNLAITQDSSILTKEKSLVIIIFKDKTRMVIGPKSKVIVKKFSKDNQGVITLLKGRIRTKVQRNKKDKNLKFFVKSRTASLGVRGTTFQTTYNPENKLTSLLTLSGEVTMVKTKKTLSNDKPVDIKSLSKLLNTKKAVSVKAGTYSGVSDNLKLASKPVKISPIQFAHIKLNDSFGVEKKVVTKKELQKEIKMIQEHFANDKTNKESQDVHINPESGSYHPRSGGLVDIETGIYVPPSKEAKYDKKLKIFICTDKIGSVSHSGKYVAPKGIILSATKGFIAKNDINKKESRNLLKELNHQIKGQIKRPKKQKPSLENLNNDDVYEKYFEN